MLVSERQETTFSPLQILPTTGGPLSTIKYFQLLADFFFLTVHSFAPILQVWAAPDLTGEVTADHNIPTFKQILSPYEH